MAEKKTGGVRKGSPSPNAITLVINGQVHDLNVGSRPGEVEVFHTLSQTLRDTLGLTGTKLSCDNGACGCCTVIMEGKAVLSCKILTVECDGKENNDYRRAQRPEDRRTRPAPAGVHRPYGLPVRLLHARA